MQSLKMTIESESLARISAYLAENKRKSALEAEKLQTLAIKAKVKECEDGQQGQTTASESQMLDCIYDNEPLRFDKDPLNELQRMQAQDPLKEIDLGDGVIKRPTYISIKVGSMMKAKLIEVFKEYIYCFAWDYGKMPGLNRSVVEHRLHIRPVKQHP